MSAYAFRWVSLLASAVSVAMPSRACLSRFGDCDSGAEEIVEFLKPVRAGTFRRDIVGNYNRPRSVRFGFHPSSIVLQFPKFSAPNRTLQRPLEQRGRT